MDYSAITDAIADTHGADTWFSDTDHVITIESGLRADIAEALRPSLGYALGEMPAVCVATRDQAGGLAPEDSVQVDDGTYGAAHYTVPLVIFGIMRKSKEADARLAAVELREQIERVVKEQALSGTDWGISPCVTQLSSMRGGIEIVADGKSFLGICEVAVDVITIES